MITCTGFSRVLGLIISFILAKTNTYRQLKYLHSVYWVNLFVGQYRFLAFGGRDTHIIILGFFARICQSVLYDCNWVIVVES